MFSLDKGQLYPKIFIVQSKKILVASWEPVTQETVMNCSKKAGITSDTQRAAVADSDDPFKDLQESLDAVKIIFFKDYLL